MVIKGTSHDVSLDPEAIASMVAKARFFLLNVCLWPLAVCHDAGRADF